MGLFDLEGALGFYGSYHNNRINQLIHVVFVPIIVWSAMVIFDYISLDMVLGYHVHPFGAKANSLHPVIGYINDRLVLGGGTALFIGLSIYYLKLTYSTPGYSNPLSAMVPALTYDCFLFAMAVSAGQFFQHVSGAWTYALAAHVFAWYMQIHPGHAIFEKRSAALTDNFFGGLSLGPLFAWFEVLFTLGWNPELRNRLQVRIDQNIADWKASQKKVK